MTERLDEAKKYVKLYKKSMNKYDTEGSIMYGLRAMNMLTVIDETAREDEAKEVESLANEMLAVFYDKVDLSEYKRRGNYFYYTQNYL